MMWSVLRILCPPSDTSQVHTFLRGHASHFPRTQEIQILHNRKGVKRETMIPFSSESNTTSLHHNIILGLEVSKSILTIIHSKKRYCKAIAIAKTEAAPNRSYLA